MKKNRLQKRANCNYLGGIVFLLTALRALVNVI